VATGAVALLEESKLLSGIHVVELSSSVAGAHAGRLLATMGASVSRAAQPLETATSDAGVAHLEQWLHAGKRAFERAAQSTAAALETASLVIAEVDPGDRDFYDYAVDVVRTALKLPHNPVVVVIRHGVGDGRAVPGTALTISAWSGMSWAMGDADAAPLTLPYDLSAYQGGIHACAAGLAALLAQPNRAELRHVDVSSRDVVAYFTGMIAANFIPYERAWTREGARPPGSGGIYPASIFPCKDGHVVLMCRSQKEWDTFIAGMGTPEWAKDPKFRDAKVIARLYADEADAHLLPWLREHTEQELLDFGTRLGLPIAPVRSMRQAIEEPQLAHRGYLGNLPGTELRVPTSPWQLFERADGQSARRAWPLRPETSDTTGHLLRGLRVLDLSWVWSGPLVTSVMADLGAEVLKVEHTLSMDSSRTRGRARRDGIEVEGPEHEATPYFNQMNHGKRSITMNLKEPSARAILLDLVEHCDVVVENMRPGAMQRLGLTYEALSERNPGIVLLSMSMAGQTGPLSTMKGYAGIMAAMSGLESLIGYDQDHIVGSLGPALGDPNASGHALSVLFAALLRRRESGRGTWIDLSQTEALMNVLAGPMIDGQLHDMMLPPANRHPRFVPHGHFRCAGEDAWVAVAVRHDWEWAALVELAAGSELAAHPEWATFERRRGDVEAVEKALVNWVATRDRDTLVAELLARGIAAAPVASYQDLIASDWKSDRALTVTVEHPYLGATEVFVVPWRFGGVRPAVVAPAPLLGSSTEPVLGELLNMPADEVRRLQRDLVLH
jgi:crotonobetainyl-CoA:carnitine CoA-transferase CaiB-like acyl-CoA transferase